MIKRLLLSGTVAVAAVLLFAVSLVYAIDDPDSMSIKNVIGYKGVFEAGDLLVVVHANILYSSLPDETVSEAFIGRFMTSTASVELSSVFPATYSGTITDTTAPPASGYGDIVFSFYFPAIDNPAYNCASCYTVILQGNPLVFPGSPASVDETVLAWVDATNNKAQLESDIRGIAVSLELNWNSNSVDLVDFAVVGGPFLSANGESYFVEAIPNLRTIAPGLFSAATVAVPFTEQSFTQDYQDEIESYFDGTEVATGTAAAGSLFGVSNSMVRSWYLFAAILVFASIAIKFTGRPEAGMLVGLAVYSAGPFIGLGSLSMVMIGALASSLAIGYWFVLRNAQ